jgi:hypothetical protein
MLDVNNVLASLADGMKEAYSAAGFAISRPEGISKDAPPVVVSNDRSYIAFSGDGHSLRLEYCNNAVGLLYAEAPAAEAADGDYTRLSLSLLDLSEADDKDLKYISGDFSETLEERFSSGKKPKSKKSFTTVSKTAVRNGAFYDSASFGNRFTALYPELRSYFKQNCDEYGEFLPEDFFKKYGTPAVIETIRENNPQKMKKLFNLLNETYENGVNEVQSLIVVSILGTMHDDEKLLANCVDYMDGELCVNVINVNKYLNMPGSKGMRMRLENPPRYKPKKEKKNFLAALSGAGQQ